MSAPTVYFAQPRRLTIAYPRLRLKPAHSSAGFVQGGWWPRSDRLYIELPLLLAALPSRSGVIERVIYDENNWAPAALRQEFQGHSVILEPSTTSPNSLTLSGKRFGTLVLLVVPHDTDQATATTAVTMAADPDNVSSAEDLLQIAKPTRRRRRRALVTQPRCGSDDAAVPRRGHNRSESAIA
ncbi:hypothetical protein MGALJ_42870 [Mycobacterium gallinarum]|uniref:Uncharacterized protein n=1 Tax=Mycobacterium gallinarum TaxID=39689 RepID=A0A9W4B5X8_9MYCO|nr:DUF5994 family protein [Mycobacterium gallinarum]BBY94618.1 hypothetical protein MGALJ_42870 [Mycobacterium gallinarum]